MRKFIFLCIIQIILSSVYIYSQSSIKGKVLDNDDDSPLLGVDVFINELKIGTTTDQNGEFNFINIKNGNYTIKFSFIGYQTIIKNIQIENSSTENIIVKLKQSAININEVVVTGNPFLTDPKDISQTTIALSKLDLIVNRGNSIAQTLDFQPGVAMRSNGVAAGRPVIRGFSNNMVLVLENGLRMGDLSGASDDHAVTDDGSEPEKIEVLEGPSSLLYGSNAIGGVVNIITESIPSSVYSGINGDVQTGLSSMNGEYLGNLHVNYGIDKYSFHSEFFKRKANDYTNGLGVKTYNSNLDSYGSEVGFSAHPNWGTAGISYSNYKNEYGLPALPTSDEISFISMHKNELRFLTNISKINSFVTSMSLKAGYLNYNHDEISRITGDIGTSFGQKTYTADLSFTHLPIIKNSNGIFGFYGLVQNYNVTGAEALTPNADYNNYAFYFLEQFKFDYLHMNFGARYEINKIKFPESVLTDSVFNSGNEKFNSLSLSYGISYNFLDNYSVFANVANAFRSPTIEELSSFAVHEALASFDIGNRNLSIEKNTGFDLGFRNQNENLFVEITGYYNIINNFIIRSPQNYFYSTAENSTGTGVNGFNNSDGFRVYQYNQADAVLYGFESKIKFELLRNLSTTIISDYVRAKLKNISENLPQIPPLRFGLEFRYTSKDYWIGTKFKLTAAQNDVAPNEDPTKGYGIVDIYSGLRINLGNYANVISVRVSNIFDQPYKDHLSAIKDFTYMPGRNISLNYKFIF